jgi:hypothetical protein
MWNAMAAPALSPIRNAWSNLHLLRHQVTSPEVLLFLPYNTAHVAPSGDLAGGTFPRPSFSC